jgi:hypothetical protein
MRLVDRAATDRPRLNTGARIALEALTYLVADTKTPVHVDDWRAETYQRGIAETTESKRKAFSRARKKLLDDEIVVCNDDFYIPADFNTERDKAGHSRDMSPFVRGARRDRTGQPSIEGVPCPALVPQTESLEESLFLTEQNDNQPKIKPVTF